MYPENKAFSPDLPTYQLQWDSVSYGTFKECPYKYYLSIVCGFQSRRRSVHLAFGIAFHAAVEMFHKLRANGESLESATFLTMRAAYYRQLLTPAERNYGVGFHEHSIPFGDKPEKTPHTFLRTLLWYLDQFGPHEEGPGQVAETYILQNGKPAVELSFAFPYADNLVYRGHFDRIVAFADKLWVSDYKTTTSQLNAHYFAQFSPDVQMSGYTLAGKIVFDAPTAGVLIDAAKVAVTSSEFSRQPVMRSPGQLDEWLDDLRFDTEVIARLYAERDSWPMNPKACHHFGGCQFRKICSSSPAVRPNFLEADFIKRIWDPTVER